MRAVRGFSVIELVTVLVLIGALAVFALPRLNTAGFSAYGFHEELLAAVRHAQKTATASRCEVRVEVSASGDDYAVTYTGAGPDGCMAQPVTAPGRGGNLAGSAPAQVDINQGATIVFDGFGVPGSAATIEINNRRQVVVEAFTGYVHD